jgi:biotin carboxyl carrier protein
MTGAMDTRRAELRVDSRDGEVRLLSPGVGLFTRAEPPGRVLTAGQTAGQLVVLGRAIALVVPGGVTGVVRSPLPERVREPVAWDTVLYELDSLDAADAQLGAGVAAGDADGDAGGLVVRAPQTGRFWHRAAPGEPAFVSAGEQIGPGHALGLIEVMKTFTQVPYTPSGTLPTRARVVRLLVQDGEDVTEGVPLVEVEPVE